MVSLDSYQNTSRFSHDAITRHGANQRYTLLHVRGCARETVFFFFYVQKKRSARVHVEARVKHGGLMNYNISLNISLPSSPLFSFRRILGIKALSHQCATTTPGKAALAPWFYYASWQAELSRQLPPSPADDESTVFFFFSFLSSLPFLNSN